MTTIESEQPLAQARQDQLETLTKRQRMQSYWKPFDQDDYLICPHCQGALHLNKDATSFVCSNGHQFDCSKQGSVHLATKAYSSNYDTELFLARRRVITESDFFAPLYDDLRYLILKYIADEPGLMIDAGSGEASHLYQLLAHDSMQSLWEQPYLALDLASDGVKLATDYNGWFLNAVADLANLPVAANSARAILSIFSPSNYASFRRCLAADGYMVKVFPGEAYLTEIRQQMRRFGIEITDYSNEKPKELLAQAFSQPVGHTYRREERFVSKEAKEAILAMTPMTWQLTDEQRQELIDTMPRRFTLAYEIRVCQADQSL